MKIQIIKPQDMKTTTWRGGKTTEIAISPNHACMDNKDFSWRLSTAVIEADETEFTSLPDYDRMLIILEGEVVLAHQNQRVSRLRALERDCFGGEVATKSFGRATDYNLIWRKGFIGEMDSICAEPECVPFIVEREPGFAQTTLGLFCFQGYAVITVGHETVMLEEGQQFLAFLDPPTASDDLCPCQVSVMGEGKLIRTFIHTPSHPEFAVNQTGPSVEPTGPNTPRESQVSRSKVSFRDYLAAVKLANTRFRGSQYLFRSQKNQYFDHSLEMALSKLEKWSLPLLSGVLGWMMVGLLAMNWLGRESVLFALLLWIPIHMLVISPLLYLLVIPKPVADHMKEVSDMTNEERQERMDDLTKNEKARRILEKYSRTGLTDQLREREAKRQKEKD